MDLCVSVCLCVLELIRRLRLCYLLDSGGLKKVRRFILCPLLSSIYRFCFEKQKVNVRKKERHESKSEITNEL